LQAAQFRVLPRSTADHFSGSSNPRTHLIMCTKPVNAPDAAELLGKVTDTGYRPPEPHPTEALYRQLFRWD
jgi:hypothetical protein